MREPFVGRAGELATLNSRYAMAAGGRGQVVLITGPPGIGKTMLAGEFLAAYERPAMSVSGDPDEAGLAGGLLEQFAAQAPGPAAESLSGLLASGHADPLSAGAALLALIAEVRREEPQVLVVDDAGWGDELSLKALGFAVRRLRDKPVCCLISVRSDGLHKLPRGLLRTAESQGERLDLGGLQVTDIVDLARLAGFAWLSPRAATRLQEHTGGVPLHIKELLRDLPPAALRDPAAVLPAPYSLELLVLSRLAGCAADTERLVVAAAVLGTDCRLIDAAALAGLDDPLAALQEAVEGGLLAEADSPSDRLCRFPHALIRSAVYGDIGAGRRAAMHRLAAERMSGPAALAHRVAACPASDLALAADLEGQARADLMAGQHARAIGHLLAAIKVGESGATNDRRLLSAVASMLDIGDIAQARSHGAQVAELPPSSARDLVLSRLALFSGDFLASGRRLAAAWTEPGDDHVAAACELALTLLGQHQTSEAARWARRAVAAPASGFHRACSLSVLGACQALSGQPDEALDQLRGELAHGDGGQVELMLRQGIGTVLLWSDHPDQASLELMAATSVEGPSGIPLAHLLAGLYTKLAADYRRGAWDQSAAGARRLLTLAEDLDQDWLSCRAHTAAVYVSAGRGEWEEAAAHAQSARRMSRLGHPADDLDLANAATALAVARDDPQAAIAAAEPVLDQLGRLAELEPTMLGFWPGLAWALIRQDQLDEAGRIIDLFEDSAKRRGRRSMLAAAARTRGRLLAAQGQTDLAIASLADGVSYLDGLTLPFDHCMAMFELGLGLRRLGKRRPAERWLWQARAGFSALGAQPFARRCDDELGQDPGSDLAAAGLPLTDRQLAVARAVAAGMSNKQVAAELFVSVKTVEFHVSQILARLGIDRRQEIGQAIGPDPAGRAAR
jgi:DNA-binding CsgD family transcriptional regulator